ncbi:MAG: Fic family protein [Acidimicrobiia bacterium]|nr:Fic family protein [Acidimicrobiia bacterium]
MREHFSPGRRGRPPRVEVYRRLDTQIGELWERLGGLPSPLEAVDIWRGIWFEEAHHSTAIEGNTLALKQVEVLLSEGRAVGDRELKEYLEVRGYADAADWVYRQAITPGQWSAGKVLSLTEIRHVHRVLMAAVWEVAPHPEATQAEGPGSFREHEIHPLPGGMTPVSWPLVPAQLDGWLDDVNRLRPRDPAFSETVADLHARFERIHPFLDGNGRAGRLVLNLSLVRLGYPPAIVYKRQRSEYLRALRRADRDDPGQLGELLTRAVLDNLYRFVVPAIAGPARLVPLAALADERASADALRVAAARGRLQATRGADCHWRSTRTWVDEYLAARYRRTPWRS